MTRNTTTQRERDKIYEKKKKEFNQKEFMEVKEKMYERRDEKLEKLENNNS